MCIKVVDVVMKESFDLWEFNIRDVLRWCELMIKHQVEYMIVCTVPYYSHSR